MHRVLARQLRRLSLAPDTPPDLTDWQQFLERVERSYAEADAERYTSERLMELSSQEMAALYQQLRDHDQRRFQALVAGSSDTTIVVDAAGKVAYVSPRAASGRRRAAGAADGGVRRSPRPPR